MTVSSKPKRRKLGIVALICGLAGFAGAVGWSYLDPVISGGLEDVLEPIMAKGGRAVGATGLILGLVILQPKGRKLGVVALICGLAGFVGVGAWFCLEPVISAAVEDVLAPIMVTGGTAAGAIGLILGLAALVIARRDVAKYLLAVGAILTGGLAVTPWVLITIVCPPSRESPKQTICVSNLRGIGQVMHLYAKKNEGPFPPDFETLIQTHWAGPKQFLCPEADKKYLGDLHASYVYIAGQSIHSDPGNVLIYEKPGNHDEGGNVLFVDGHVLYQRPHSLVTELVGQTRQRLAEGRATTWPDGGD